MASNLLFHMPILVVDDEPTNTKLLDRILSKAGYQSIIVTNDPCQTIPLFHQHQPGVILLDLNMPQMDGFSVLSELRTNSPDTMPPVVVLTAQSDQASRLKALQGGARDFVTKPFDRTELLVRIENMLALKQAEQERVRFYAYFDSVTGLPNRTYSVEMMRDLLANSAQKKRAVAVLMLSLQQFKRINQSFGHENGDRLLKLCKERIQTVLTGKQVILGRMEGARFLIVIPGVDSECSHLTDHIQKMTDAVQVPAEINGIEIRPISRIGIALFPVDADNTNDLLARAEAALAIANQQTHHAYAFCNPGTDAKVREQLELEAELHRALERQEFFLVYQPQVELITGRICGVEALLRWRHPHRGVVAPDQFIPMLEDTGLIIPASEWIMREAFRQIVTWHSAGIENLRIAVNLSPRQFQSNNLIAQIRQAIAETGIETHWVELEVTESLLIEDFPGTRQLLDKLTALGIRIALDDFGTGYSALTYLHAFPFHALKIDRSFVSSIGGSPKSEALLRGIIQLAKSLQFEVIAEGIETDVQRRYLLDHDCETGQGFGFCRPMLPTDLEPILQQSIIKISNDA